MGKLINFSDEQEEVIQAYADAKVGGNFTMAVRMLCDIGIVSVPDTWTELPPQTLVPVAFNDDQPLQGDS